MKDRFLTDLIGSEHSIRGMCAVRRGPGRTHSGSIGWGYNQARSGFALVLALSLMAFIVLLVLSLVSLIRVEQQASAGSLLRLEAKQNALLGLTVAMGELQHSMGPDRRINAAAARGLPEDTTAPHTRWTGVWAGWEPSASDPAIGADPDFRRWLVSAFPDGTNPAWLEDPAGVMDNGFDAPAALNGPTGRDVTLVRGDDADRVVAGTTPAGTDQGNFAWWIGDENSKAFLRRAPPDEGSLSRWWSDRNSGAVTAFPLITGLDWLAPSAAGLERLNSRSTIRNLAGAPAGDAAIRGRDFHTLTPYAHSVLADVRKGGLRRDLSIFLETDRADRPMDSLYSMPGRRFKANFRRPDWNAPYNPADIHGPGFEEMWTYQNIWKELEGSRVSPRLVSNYEEDTKSSMAFYKTPSIVRAGWFVALSSEPVEINGQPKRRALLRFNPFIQVWNPYDIPLKIANGDQLKLTLLGFPYEVEFRVSSSPGDAAGSSKQGDWFMAMSEQFRAGFNFVELTLEGDDTEALDPGETRIFSATGFDSIEIGDERNNPKQVFLEGKAGWNREGGIVIPVFLPFSGTKDHFEPTDYLYLRFTPIENFPAWPGQDVGRPNSFYYAGFWTEPVVNAYVPEIQGMMVNDGYYPYGFRPPHRFADHPDKFPNIPEPGSGFASDLIPVNIRMDSMDGVWTDIGLLSFEMRTEDAAGAAWPGAPGLHLFNPGTGVVQYDSWEDEDLVGQIYQFKGFALSSPNDLDGVLDFDTSDGSAFFGPSYSGFAGVEQVATYAIPRGPLGSLADLQHMAGLGRGHFTEGQSRNRLRESWKTGNYLGPSVGHVIGNSYAHPLLPPEAVRGTANPVVTRDDDPGSPAVDHSYLANHELWDSWFFSTIAPEPDADLDEARAPDEVWGDFLDGSRPLPVSRFTALPDAETSDLFRSDGTPVDDADRIAAGHLLVEGGFNVNSVSTDVWAAQLAPLRGRAVPVRASGGGGVSWESVAGDATPFSRFGVSPGGSVEKSDLSNASSTEQWIGYRVIDDTDIEALAAAVVEEVRKRGPFTSLADFVNRDPGMDPELAAKGALQAALDRTLNPSSSLSGGSRWLGADSRARFPEAMDLPKSLGMPGWIYQADVLALLGPIPTVRSDTFVIRAYGSSEDEVSGERTAEAWAEAVVQRLPDFVDPANPPHTPVDSGEAGALGLTALSALNEAFGRRFHLVDFRWLGREEL